MTTPNTAAVTQEVLFLHGDANSLHPRLYSTYGNLLHTGEVDPATLENISARIAELKTMMDALRRKADELFTLSKQIREQANKRN